MALHKVKGHHYITWQFGSEADTNEVNIDSVCVYIASFFAMFYLLFAVCRSDVEHCACAEHNAMCLLLLFIWFASDGSYRFNDYNYGQASI